MYIVLDYINDDKPEFKTLREAKRYIFECFTDRNEGIHPDVDYMKIVKSAYYVDVVRDKKVKNKEVYNLKFVKDE